MNPFRDIRAEMTRDIFSLVDSPIVNEKARTRLRNYCSHTISNKVFHGIALCSASGGFGKAHLLTVLEREFSGEDLRIFKIVFPFSGELSARGIFKVFCDQIAHSASGARSKSNILNGNEVLTKYCRGVLAKALDAGIASGMLKLDVDTKKFRQTLLQNYSQWLDFEQKTPLSEWMTANFLKFVQKLATELASEFENANEKAFEQCLRFCFDRCQRPKFTSSDAMFATHGFNGDAFSELAIECVGAFLALDIEKRATLLSLQNLDLCWDQNALHLVGKKILYLKNFLERNGFMFVSSMNENFYSDKLPKIWSDEMRENFLQNIVPLSALRVRGVDDLLARRLRAYCMQSGAEIGSQNDLIAKVCDKLEKEGKGSPSQALLIAAELWDERKKMGLDKIAKTSPTLDREVVAEPRKVFFPSNEEQRSMQAETNLAHGIGETKLPAKTPVTFEASSLSSFPPPKVTASTSISSPLAPKDVPVPKEPARSKQKALTPELVDKALDDLRVKIKKSQQKSTGKDFVPKEFKHDLENVSATEKNAVSNGDLDHLLTEISAIVRSKFAQKASKKEIAADVLRLLFQEEDSKQKARKFFWRSSAKLLRKAKAMSKRDLAHELRKFVLGASLHSSKFTCEIDWDFLKNESFLLLEHGNESLSQAYFIGENSSDVEHFEEFMQTRLDEKVKTLIVHDLEVTSFKLFTKAFEKRMLAAFPKTELKFASLQFEEKSYEAKLWAKLLAANKLFFAVKSELSALDLSRDEIDELFSEELGDVLDELFKQKL